ncbi:hypothetical protein Clacol_000783 [Clathrus columnatus]|uniref:Uncharacterized protein n=1 Tax=Clathrus columnatus TaxID=1419009 RepID=A0AAV5A0P3_9AGAM|nr:hypothetical protein Clacol_000783 [Clathrus columnatus]
MTPLKKRHTKLKKIEDKSCDLESMKNTLRQEFRDMLSNERQAYNDKLAETNAKLAEQSGELCRLKSFLNPLLFRVLVDDLRRLIADNLKKQNWHEIERNRRQEIVEEELNKLRKNSPFSKAFRSSPLDMAVFLINDHSKRRNEGKERNMFIDCYRLLYNQEPTL